MKEDTKPVDTKPVDTKPVETKPVETKPVETKPVETKPVDTKPVDTNEKEPSKDVYLIRESSIMLDSDNLAEGVKSLILEGHQFYLDGSLELDSLYLTSGEYPSMTILSTTKSHFEDIAEVYSDGSVYGVFALNGVQKDFTEMSVEDFPYDGAIALEFNGELIAS